MTRWMGVTATLFLVTVVLDVTPSRAHSRVWPAATGMRRAGGLLAAGSLHTCMVRGDGTVHCWGNNGFGQLGTNDTLDQLVPVPVVASLPNTVALTAGAFHTCALRADGAARCWGGNFQGQLGDGTTAQRLIPVAVSGLTNAVALAAGQAHTCALRADGTVHCWGDNAQGQLGTNDTLDRLQPAPVSGVTHAVALVAGQAHTCALQVDGTARCWGRNTQGQLGTNDTQGRPLPVAVSGLTHAVALAAGEAHTCALRVDSTVHCWGDNAEGQLGTNDTLDRLVPTAVRGPLGVGNLNDVVALAAGASHTCAIHDAAPICWGDNTQGQLGDGTTLDRLVPFPAPMPPGETLATGFRHTCALIFDTVYCWGRNFEGQLGDGTTEDKTQPHEVAGSRGSISGRGVWAGELHTCALRVNSTVACWGSNGSGQLGTGDTMLRIFPTTVPSPSIFGGPLSGNMTLAAGEFHTCVLDMFGNSECWGNNSSGQIGRDPEDVRFRTEPQSVFVPSAFSGVALAAGDSSTCVLRDNGTAYCWGGGGSNPHLPKPVPGLNTAIALAKGSFHTCALLADGTVRCWGNNSDGQLGDGTRTSQPAPVPVSGLSTAVALAAGGNHTCAVRADGTVRCWGDNAFGQLGDEDVTSMDRLTPEPVFGLTNILALAAGERHTCALRASGRAICWGDNTRGQLGDGTTIGRSAPLLAVLQLTNAVALTAGESHTCALRADGQPFCWGRNDRFQVGNGTPLDQSAPVAVPSFSFNIDPMGELRAPGRRVTLTALAQCPADQRVKIQVSLTQGETVGKGSTVGACTGRLDPYPVHISAQGPTRFMPGAAQAEATAHIRDQGAVVDTQEWTRSVTLQSQ